MIYALTRNNKRRSQLQNLTGSVDLNFYCWNADMAHIIFAEILSTRCGITVITLSPCFLHVFWTRQFGKLNQRGDALLECIWQSLGVEAFSSPEPFGLICNRHVRMGWRSNQVVVFRLTHAGRTGPRKTLSFPGTLLPLPSKTVNRRFDTLT